MDIIKKNWMSVTFGVMALLAVVANFYPLSGMRQQLITESTAHASNASVLRGLLTKPRNMPILDPSRTETETLSAFPSKTLIDLANAANNKVKEAATAMAKNAREINKHAQLVDSALPDAGGDQVVLRSRFAHAYVSMFPPPAPTNGAAAAPLTGGLVELLKAGMPPSPAEILARREENKATLNATLKQTDQNGSVTNQADIDQQVLLENRKIADDMRKKAAENCKVYIDPNAFSAISGITATSNPEPTTIFWAQIGLWTQQDLCRTIADLNKPSQNVIGAPIKEVVRIQFINSNLAGQQASGAVPVFVMPGLQVSANNGVVGLDVAGAVSPTDPNALASAPADPNAALAKNFQLSPSGRVSNPLYDVLQFEVELIVDASKVSQVVEGLGGNQLMSVTEIKNVDAIDSAYYRGLGYYFGDSPCVKLKCRGEELFMRDWLSDYVPQQVKTKLGYPAPAAPAT